MTLMFLNVLSHKTISSSIGEEVPRARDLPGWIDHSQVINLISFPLSIFKSMAKVKSWQENTRGSNTSERIGKSIIFQIYYLLLNSQVLYISSV